MKKRVISGILSASLIVGIGIGGTFAYFNSTAASTTKTIVSGTLKLGSNMNGKDVAEKFASLNLNGLEPGEKKVIATTNLKNVGNVPFTLYRVTAANYSGFTSIAERINVNIKINNENVYEGKLSEMGVESGGFFEPIKNIPEGVEFPMTITATLDEDAGNLYQDKAVYCDFTVYAQQLGKPILGGVIKQQLGTSADGVFTLSGYNNTRLNLDIDWLKNYDPKYTYKDYIIHIKNETDKDNITVKEFYVKIKYNIFSAKFELTDLDGISQNQVSIDPDNDIIRISSNAIPSNWKGLQVMVEGRRDLLKSYDTLDWTYWSLDGLQR